MICNWWFSCQKKTEPCKTHSAKQYEIFSQLIHTRAWTKTSSEFAEVPAFILEQVQVRDDGSGCCIRVVEATVRGSSYVEAAAQSFEGMIETPTLLSVLILSVLISLLPCYLDWYYLCYHLYFNKKRTILTIDQSGPHGCHFQKIWTVQIGSGVELLIWL